MPPANNFTSCKACRRLKRRCSRDVPSCRLCTRLGKACEYEMGEVYTSADTHLEQSANTSLSPHMLQNSIFPCAYFLDPDLYKPIPRHALTSSLSSTFVNLRRRYPNSSALDPFICHYETTIHRWLPILSIKMLRKELSNFDSGPTSLLVFLALEAFMTQGLASRAGNDAPPQSNAAYFLTKKCSFMAECEGTIDVGLVQTVVLIALYELGHGIYPAAYLTIGQAVRLGTLIGLQSERYAKQLFEAPDTWTTCEAQRRTWWGILILDAAVVTGSPELLMAAPDPVKDCLLPCNDHEWEAGRIGINEALLTPGFHSPLALGEFARLCQATYILRKVVRHVQARRVAVDVAEPTSEALQLHGILKALDGSFTDQEPNMHRSHHAAQSLCSVARLTLYNQYACNEFLGTIARERVAAEVELQRISLAGIREIASKTIPHIAGEILLSQQQPLYSSCSPLLPVCFYHAATECAWFIKEDEDTEMAAGLEVIVSALQALKPQWSVCNKYISYLEGKELTL